MTSLSSKPVLSPIGDKFLHAKLEEECFLIATACVRVCVCVCVSMYAVGTTSVEQLPAVIPLTTLHAIILIGQTMTLGHSVGNSDLTVLLFRHSMLPQTGVY